MLYLNGLHCISLFSFYVKKMNGYNNFQQEKLPESCFISALIVSQCESECIFETLCRLLLIFSVNVNPARKKHVSPFYTWLHIVHSCNFIATVNVSFHVSEDLHHYPLQTAVLKDGANKRYSTYLSISMLVRTAKSSRSRNNMLSGNKLQTRVTFTLDGQRSSGDIYRRETTKSGIYPFGSQGYIQHVRKSSVGERFNQTLFLWGFLSNFKGLPAYRIS